VRAQRRARIVLVGDGPERARVEALAREAGLAEHLEILGELDDVRPLLSVADAFLLPSAQESFGLAALEAMACGAPVVASRVGGLPEVITDGLTGFLRDPDDHAGMAQAILDLLDDPSLRQRVAALARASVVDRFDEDRVVPMYEALYERLLAVPAAASRG
jgi:glycosyltransferase involved in cell wall biosynthesis